MEMDWDEYLLIIILFVNGVWMILHSAKALRRGVFVGWYHGTFKEYYIFRDKTPLYFYVYITLFSLFGSFTIGLATYFLNMTYGFM